MTELVVPDSLEGPSRSNADRLSLPRELVGRLVVSFDGAEDERIVDGYVHQDGRPLSVSAGVEQSHPE